MPILELLYSNGLWISLPLLAAGVALLVTCIRNVIRLRAENQILSIPLAEQQYIAFSEAGRVVLCIDGPLFTRRFAKTEFELCASDGTPIKGRTTWFHARSSSFSRVRMDMKIYDIPMPGDYALRVLNLRAPQPKDQEHRIVFMKPHLAQAVVYVIGIVLSSLMCVGSIVLFLLRFIDDGA